MSRDDVDKIDLDTLAAWMDAEAPTAGAGPLTAAFLSGGSTNLIVSLRRGDTRTVLRSPPLAGSPQGEKTIEREAILMRGLNGTSVPHPRFHAYCADRSIIGVPFYIMDLVDGWAATLTPENVTLFPDRFAEGPDQHYLAYAMVDGLIEMANLDYRAAGLETFGKPDGFLERQVDRWLGQLATYPAKYDKYEGRKLPGLDTVVDWLRANVPESWRPGLMHGDYAMNNVLFANAPPARLVAIVDWETATIGDPMLDLAAFTMNMRSRDGTEKIWSYFEPERFPYREDAIAYYGERTGRDISPIDYYYVLYRFRAACILEYKVAEAIQGLSPKAKGDRFDGLVRMLMESAESLVRKLG